MDHSCAGAVAHDHHFKGLPKEVAACGGRYAEAVQTDRWPANGKWLLCKIFPIREVENTIAYMLGKVTLLFRSNMQHS